MDKPKWYFTNTKELPKAEYLAAVMDNIALGAISDESEELFKCVAKLLRAGAKMRNAEYGHYIFMAKEAWDAALGDEND